MSLIIFDFDGVLADTAEDMIQFAQESCDELGISHKVVLSDLSTLGTMSFRDYGRRCEVPENRLDEFIRLCLQKFASKKSPQKIFDGMTGVLAELSKENKVAIVTGNTTQNVQTFLNEYELTSFIRTIYGVDEPGSKAEKILMAKEKLSAGKEPAYMIGDSVSDIESAKSAGVQSIAVSWGHQDIQMLIDAKPDHFVKSPMEIIDIVRTQ